MSCLPIGNVSLALLPKKQSSLSLHLTVDKLAPIFVSVPPSEITLPVEQTISYISMEAQISLWVVVCKGDDRLSGDASLSCLMSVSVVVPQRVPVSHVVIWW